MITDVSAMNSKGDSPVGVVSVRGTCLAIWLLSWLLLVCLSRPARATCNEWQPGEGLRGFDDKVHATIFWHRSGGQPPVLVAGGDFTIAGTNFVNHIAFWDGSS